MAFGNNDVRRGPVNVAVIRLNSRIPLEHDTQNTDPVPVWLWLAIIAFTFMVFAIGWWRFGSVWMGLASVLAEIAIVAIPFAFGAIPK